MKSSEYFILEQLNDNYNLKLKKDWNKKTLPSIIDELKKINIQKDKKLIVDFQELLSCDSSAMIYLISFFKKFKEHYVRE